MQDLLLTGLVLALLGPPAALLAFRRAGLDRLTFGALWLLAALAVLIAVIGSSRWLSDLGLSTVSPKSLAYSFLAAVSAIVIVAWAQALQRSAFGVSETQKRVFHKLVSRSPRFKLLVLLTAAVAEEILYRGYAIGIGQHFLGVWSATCLSIAIFTVCHYRWGGAHLVSVFLLAIIFSLLFVLTNDLVACILAHAAVNAVGYFLVPLQAPKPGSTSLDSKT